MPRLARVSPIDFPLHIIQRGNNRQKCFSSDGDKKAYIHWLKEYADSFKVDIHAWVLMTNHVHLLCTPKITDGASKMMQCLGRMYVPYFNVKYGRTGTLWEGRFKSCLVQSEHYLLAVYRYIELNPVRSRMVNDPAEYSWSSYQCNALGKKSSLLTPHQIYLSLGSTDSERQSNYQNLFGDKFNRQQANIIRRCTNSGAVLGDNEFKQLVENTTGLQVTLRKRGRPSST